MSTPNGTAEKIQDVTQDAAKELGEVARELRHKANEIRKEAVSQLNKAAESMRREVRANTDDGAAHKTADEVAKGLEKAAHYLNTRSVEQMGDEATKVVRRNPMRVMLITLGVGIILGLLLRGSDKK
jgi:ElaB/YqjD/DUF883 family membrane-anchored ribosome-binding protein